MNLGFPAAYAITLALETALLFLIFRGRHAAFLIFRNSLIVNTVTLPFVWFFFPLFGWPYAIQIAVSEAFAFIAEALLYWRLFPKASVYDALFASFVCNAASFLLGVVLVFYI
jgi:hypothetical protein